MWKAVRYDDSYFDSIIDMSVENFGEENDICNKDFLKHQYFDNPVGSALIELAVDPNNGTLAGQYVVAPAKFRCFGKNILVVTSLNTLTRKAYRGQKIFVGLAEKTYARATQDGFAFCYGAPNQNSHHGFIAKLGFKDICEFPLYIRPLDTSKMVEQRMHNKLLTIAAKPFNLFFYGKGQNTKGIAELTEDNIYLMDEFWNKVKDYYQIIGVRDAKYIHYRYMNVPRRIYYPYVAIEMGQVVAFAVGRIREMAHFNCGMIVDFLYVKGFEKQAGALIELLVKRMKDEGASLAGCIMLSHTKEAKELTKCGFFKCPDKLLPQPTPLILRVFENKLNGDDKVNDIKNWFFTTGDYDVV
ncbi:MAG: GNAT family N-acetyltransferase [Oscillospiraceae bacterium]